MGMIEIAAIFTGIFLVIEFISILISGYTKGIEIDNPSEFI